MHLVEGLLVALLDIDEVIQVIRSSEDSGEARDRLMSVFDLTEVQAKYILDTPLRRLTKYDRLELEKEGEDLRRTIAALREWFRSDPAVLIEDKDCSVAVHWRNATDRDAAEREVDLVLGALAAETGLHPSTAHRILSAMSADRLVQEARRLAAPIVASTSANCGSGSSSTWASAGCASEASTISRFTLLIASS
jgi:DNA gyrase subunit A